MTETPQVMVLEDNAAMRNFLYACVSASGYTAVAAGSTNDAIRRFRASPPSAVILSLAAPRPTRTLRTIAVLHAIDPQVPMIVIAGHARAPMIAQALNRGASDFVSAPFDEADIEAALGRVIGHQDSGRLLHQRRRERGRTTPQGRLVGSGAAIRHVRAFVERAAATDLTVLIRGESGTGKTLVAREIVAASPRWDQPFVKVNCAARPDELVDAELLALAAGGFGGLTDLGSKFACAADGTLFFDEVGEMSPSMQGRLLKILQDRESAHLHDRGGSHGSVRIIAASSGDLEHAVADGRLREELFFRLNVLSIQLPPLRERRGDIRELADYFLRCYSTQYRVPAYRLSPGMLRLLAEHEWPGNVRELENVIRRIALLGTEEAVAAELRTSRPAALAAGAGSAPPQPRTGAIQSPGVRSLKEHARLAAREAERTLILRALERTRGNRKEAAALLGIGYKALLKKMKECDLQNP